MARGSPDSIGSHTPTLDDAMNQLQILICVNLLVIQQVVTTNTSSVMVLTQQVVTTNTCVDLLVIQFQQFSNDISPFLIYAQSASTGQPHTARLLEVDLKVSDPNIPR